MEKEIENGAEEAAAEKKKAGWWWRRAARLELAVICFLISLLPLVALLFGGQRSSLALSPPERAAVVEGKASQNVHSATSAEPQDKLLGGLLSPDFDEQSCSSRYESSLYRRPSPFSPSSYLVQKLRKYEVYHKKCGPNTELYRKAIQQLKSGHNIEQTECKYVVWVPFNGLGNRMLSLVSTFLYALLTDRVLLTDETKGSENLFCEPFPGSSWVVPSNFPIKDMSKINMGAPQSYLNFRDSMVIGNTANVSEDSLPPYVFLPLGSGLFRHNNIFCGYDKVALEKFNWMIVKSDSYFVPATFLMPIYEDELGRLFPEKESVFHHLGRYLFHPTNRVWGMIRRYYKAYLAKADEKIGIQIRVFPKAPIPFENMYEQVLKCTRNENLLPKTSPEESRNSSSNATRFVAVQVTSLFSGYYEKIKTMYYETPTVNGEIVAVYQPSHEEEQHSEAQNHNQKALAEIYLLSFSDKIVTTAWSTFGYIAHGLTGLRPWILLRPGRMQKTAEPPCVRSTSVEPCMHFPPRVDCEDRKDVDVGTLVPYVRHCEDVNFGVKLFN